MHSPTLDALRVQQLNKAIKAQLLPRGTNSAQRSSPNFFDPPAGKKTKPVVDVNKSTNPVHARGLAFCTGIRNHAPTLLKKQAFLQARHTQSISGQSETVEQHMSMTKPVNHRYPEPVRAHDYADDWTRPAPQDKGNHHAYLRSLRKAHDANG